MYTEGIRKILYSPKQYGHIDELFKMADVTGHGALAHNGLIWIKAEDGVWVLTCFNINDFEDRSDQ